MNPANLPRVNAANKKYKYETRPGNLIEFRCPVWYPGMLTSAFRGLSGQLLISFTSSCKISTITPYVTPRTALLIHYSHYLAEVGLPSLEWV